MFRLLACLAVVFSVPAAAQTAPCGPDAACEIAGGSYHVLWPDGWDGVTALPALIFYHGHRGSGAQVFRSGGLRADFADKGYAVIAPDGAMRPGADFRSYPARAGAGRDDVAFTLAVLDDLGARVPLNRDRIYASGFSAGGSMAWLLACEAGDRLAGMVSVAGALRRPNPTDCAGLVGLPVMQVHGFMDAQVPLEGRAIGDWHQGSVWDSLARATAANGCNSNPDDIRIEDGLRIRDWNTRCSRAPVRLEMHDGAHGLPSGWTARARAFLEGAAR